jgi:hypothetical protein
MDFRQSAQVKTAVGEVAAFLTASLNGEYHTAKVLEKYSALCKQAA